MMESDFFVGDGVAPEGKDGDNVAIGVACDSVAGAEGDGDPLSAGDAIETASVAAAGDGPEDVSLPLHPVIKRGMIVKSNRIKFFNLNASGSQK